MFGIMKVVMMGYQELSELIQARLPGQVSPVPGTQSRRCSWPLRASSVALSGTASMCKCCRLPTILRDPIWSARKHRYICLLKLNAPLMLDVTGSHSLHIGALDARSSNDHVGQTIKQHALITDYLCSCQQLAIPPQIVQQLQSHTLDREQQAC